MRLAMVVHSHYPEDVRVRRQCDALADRGDEVDVICLRKPGQMSVERIANVRAYRIPVLHRRGQSAAGYVIEYLSFFTGAFLLLTRLYSRHRYPLLEVHNMPDFLVFTTIIPKLFGARVLLDMHDVTPELYQSIFGISESSLLNRMLLLIERWSLLYADAVLTVNKNIRDLFQARNPIARKIEVVMNAPDPRYFKPNGSGAASPHGGFRLFQHGQILRRYDFETTLEAFRIAQDGIPGLQLDIYGDGEQDYIDHLKRLVRQDRLEGHIRFHNRVPVEKVPRLIDHADLGLVPCRKDVFVDKVMLPVRLLEYVTMGLPAVVSKVGTVESYFGDEDVAFYPPQDASALASRIVELYRSPSARLRMADRAKATFRRYEWPQMQQQYYQVIDRLIRS